MKIQTHSSGERPDITIKDNFLRLDLIDIAPMIRYLFSFKFINDHAKTLDIGCGNGHGVLIQSFYTDHTTGVDVSDEALKVAEKIKESKNLVNVDFVRGLENVKGKFDMITAFEIIEHIDKEVGVDLIDKAFNLLKKDGVFLISTPYIDFRGKTYWPHHKHEYFLPELKNILLKHYKYVQTYYHLGDGFYLKKGFFRSLFNGNVTSSSSVILVCSNNKKYSIETGEDHNIAYLYMRGFYRNIKYLLFNK